MGASDPRIQNQIESKGHTEQELADVPQFARTGLSALYRAAAMAREIAIKTNTGIVVVRDGRPVRISAKDLRAQQLATIPHNGSF